jgi:hypothetical protein
MSVLWALGKGEQMLDDEKSEDVENLNSARSADIENSENVPPEAVWMLLKKWFVPNCIAAMSRAIASCRQILDSSIVEQADLQTILSYQLKLSDTSDTGGGGLRIQWKILITCMQILAGVYFYLLLAVLLLLVVFNAIHLKF